MVHKRSKIWKILEKDFISIVNSSKSRMEILLKLGYTNSGGSYSSLNERLDRLGLLDKVNCVSKQNMISKGKRNFDKFNKKNSIKLEDILVKSTVKLGSHYKNRILHSKVIGDVCYECGIGVVWNDKDLVLQIDHINGDPTDHRIENLRLLCPNCHSQTGNFSGRNLKSKKEYKCSLCGNEVSKCNRSNLCRSCASKSRKNSIIVVCPKKDTLISDILHENSNLCAVGRKYKVSDNTIRKWMKNYNITRANILLLSRQVW